MVAARRYHGVAILLHWLTVAAILGLFVLGLLMDDAKPGSLRQFVLFQWHKSIGISVLLLTVGRLGWRLTHRPPALPEAMPVWERRAAAAAHFLLYTFLIGLPLLGWATVSASPLNIPTILYGVVPWPHLPVLPTLDNKKVVAEWLGDAHTEAAWILAMIAIAHAAAAFRHHFLLKDDVLRRMMPPLFRRRSH